MPKKKKKLINIDDQEIDPESENEFSGIDGLPEDFKTLNLHRKNQSGKYCFVDRIQTPIDLKAIAENYGGGEFLLLALDENGKIQARKVFYVDDIYNKIISSAPLQADPEAAEIKLLEKIKIYKELFASKSETGIVDNMTKSLSAMQDISNKMVLNNFEMMQRYNLQSGDQPTGSPGGLEAVLSGIFNMVAPLFLKPGQPVKAPKKIKGGEE